MARDRSRQEVQGSSLQPPRRQAHQELDESSTWQKWWGGLGLDSFFELNLRCCILWQKHMFRLVKMTKQSEDNRWKDKMTVWICCICFQRWTQPKNTTFAHYCVYSVYIRSGGSANQRREFKNSVLNMPRGLTRALGRFKSAGWMHPEECGDRSLGYHDGVSNLMMFSSWFEYSVAHVPFSRLFELPAVTAGRFGSFSTVHDTSEGPVHEWTEGLLYIFMHLWTP